MGRGARGVEAPVVAVGHVVADDALAAAGIRGLDAATPLDAAVARRITVVVVVVATPVAADRAAEQRTGDGRGITPAARAELVADDAADDGTGDHRGGRAAAVVTGVAITDRLVVADFTGDRTTLVVDDRIDVDDAGIVVGRGVIALCGRGAGSGEAGRKREGQQRTFHIVLHAGVVSPAAVTIGLQE